MLLVYIFNFSHYQIFMLLCDYIILIKVELCDYLIKVELCDLMAASLVYHEVLSKKDVIQLRKQFIA